LSLSSNQLSGGLAPVATLTALMVLDLSSNQLSGGLAPVATLTALTYLYLDSNQLSGSLAPVAALTALALLHVASNKLSGDLAPMASLTGLSTLDLSFNKLSGGLVSLTKLTALTTLDLSSNRLMGDLAPVANLTALSTLDLSSNQFSGGLAPVATLTALSTLDLSSNQLSDLCGGIGESPLRPLANLIVINLSFNAFSDSILSLWQCLALPNSVSQLYLGSNRLKSQRLQVDLQYFPNAALIDLTDNQLGGALVLNGIQTSDTILNLTGNVFNCPMPLFSTSKLMVLSPCSPSYAEVGIYIGIALGVAILVGLPVMVSKWHERPVFKKWFALLMWLATVFNFSNDLRLLLSMIPTVLMESNNCAFVDTRQVFLSFMGTTDKFPGYANAPTFCSNQVVYLGPSGPHAPKDGTINATDINRCFGELPFTRKKPLNSQPFSDFAATLSAWSTTNIVLLPQLQDNADSFQRLCTRFPRCHVNPPNVCSNKFDESSWASKSQYSFLICVVTLITWKLSLEVVKAIIIGVSIMHSRQLAPYWTSAMLRSSPLLPVMYLVGFNPWLEILLYESTTLDRLRSLVWNTLLTKLPKVALTFWYFNYVLQRGFGTLDYLSLVRNLVTLAIELVQAVRVWRRAARKDQAYHASIIQIFHSATQARAVLPNPSGVELVQFEVRRDRLEAGGGGGGRW
jgi:hypothetical protein